jgi:hypothetical protein
MAGAGISEMGAIIGIYFRDLKLYENIPWKNMYIINYLLLRSMQTFLLQLGLSTTQMWTVMPTFHRYL